MFRSAWIAAIALVCSLCIPKAFASNPVSYDASLELRTPVYNSLPGDGWGGFRTPHGEIAGSVKLFNLLPGNTVLWVNGEHTLQQRGVFAPENTLKVGVDIPVNKSVTVFTYFDRRFNPEVNRVFVGVRVGFKGRLD